MSSSAAQSIIRTNHLYMPVIKGWKLKGIELHTSVPSCYWMDRRLTSKKNHKVSFLLKPFTPGKDPVVSFPSRDDGEAPSVSRMVRYHVQLIRHPCPPAVEIPEVKQGVHRTEPGDLTIATWWGHLQWHRPVKRERAVSLWWPPGFWSAHCIFESNSECWRIRFSLVVVSHLLLPFG